jgi:hypothetical protein
MRLQRRSHGKNANFPMLVVFVSLFWFDLRHRAAQDLHNAVPYPLPY